MGEPDATRLLAIYLDDHRAGAAGGSALARRLVDRYADEPGFDGLRELADQVDEDVSTLDRIRDGLDVSGGDLKRVVAIVGERLGRLKPNGRLASKSPLSRVEELEQMSAGVLAKRQLWSTIDVCGVAPDGIDLERLIDRADKQLILLTALHDRAAHSAFAGGSVEAEGDTDARTDDSSHARFTRSNGGVVAGMSNPMSDDDITRDGPTEDDDNLDAPGEHSKDTGDEG
jgi:hypothetical protein